MIQTQLLGISPGVIATNGRASGNWFPGSGGDYTNDNTWYQNTSQQAGAVGTAGIEFQISTSGYMLVSTYSQYGGSSNNITNVIQGAISTALGVERMKQFEAKISLVSNTQGGTTGVSSTAFAFDTWLQLGISARWFKYSRAHTTLGSDTCVINLQIRYRSSYGAGMVHNRNFTLTQIIIA